MTETSPPHSALIIGEARTHVAHRHRIGRQHETLPQSATWRSFSGPGLCGARVGRGPLRERYDWMYRYDATAVAVVIQKGRTKQDRSRRTTREDYQLFSRRSFLLPASRSPGRPAAAEARYPRPLRDRRKSVRGRRAVRAHRPHRQRAFPKCPGPTFPDGEQGRCRRHDRRSVRCPVGTRRIHSAARHDEHVHDRTLVYRPSLTIRSQTWRLSSLSPNTHGARCKREKRISSLQ